jgi:putative ABC transport system substrate-binding protein
MSKWESASFDDLDEPDMEHADDLADEAAAWQHAAELAASSPDLLVGSNTLATAALKATGTSTPIMFVTVTDPIASGFVKNLTKPGGSITGFTDMEPLISGKWAELLTEFAPHLRTIGMMYNPAIAPWAQGYVEPFQKAASALGLQSRLIHVGALNAYRTAIADCGREGDCGLIILDNPTVSHNAGVITTAARESRVPAIYPNDGFVENFGGLMSFGIGVGSLYAQSASYIDKILKGEHPENLPVQALSKFRLWINLKAAEAIGLTARPDLLAQADRVFE